MNTGRISAVFMRRSSIPWIVFFVVVLIGLSRLIETGARARVETAWEEIAAGQSRENLQQAVRTFRLLQRGTRRLAVEVADHPSVRQFLEGSLRDSADLVAYVTRISRNQEAGIEVFDRSGRLVAWEGRGEKGHDAAVRIALDGQLTSSVSAGRVFSFLYVATPVRAGGRIAGAVLVRVPVEVNYPLSNRFINREGLSVRLTEQLGTPVEFTFDPGAEPRKDGRYLSTVLHGIDEKPLGIVSVLRPLRSASLEALSRRFRIVEALLASLLVLFLVVMAVRRIVRLRSLLVQSLLVTGAVWAARYALLFVDIPSSLVSGGIFDPAWFASKFGGGIAKSIGEMTLTSAALLANTGLVLRFVLERVRRGSPWWHPRQRPVRWILALAVTILIFLLLRGFGATIRSAVVDSTLHFADPGVIVPSFELMLMVVNLFVVSFCLIVASAGLTSFLVTLFAGPEGSVRRFGAWAASGALFALAAVLFGVFQPNPLMTPGHRLLFGAGMLAFTYSLHRQAAGRRRLAGVRNLMVALGLSALFCYPLLDLNLREKERIRLEALAADLLRPVDGWLTFVAEDLLNQLAGEDAQETLERGTPSQVADLAFTRWAASVASREGYTCRVAVIGRDSVILSQFAMGNQALLPELADLFRDLPEEKSVFLREAGTGLGAVRLYAGSVPISGGDGPAAWGVVALAAGQQTLFRGDNPAVLRSVGEERGEPRLYGASLAEYRNGLLLTATDAGFPSGRRLPEEARRRFADASVTRFWSEDDVLYVRRPGTDDAVVALAAGSGGFQWHLLNTVKVMIYYVLIVCLLVLVLFVARWLRGYRYVPTFRDKLLAVLLFTSIVPLVVLAVYGRMLARERVMESTAKLLEQETSAVAAGLAKEGVAPAGDTLRIGPAVAAGVAADLRIDFNVYTGNRLAASSRPELFETGILDTRMSGSAYWALMREGERFYMETERIGGYQYAVGYAPLLGPGRAVPGVVSVPTLHRQEEIDREASQRNALLFGLYGLVVLGIVGVATTFANRMAAPIHGLTEATRRVSRGELDIALRVPGAEGEVGELIRSFEAMTRDLKRSREELVRYERETAWKTMARQVAHEIKNPLTPMKLSLQHLQQTYRDGVPDFGRVFHEVSRTIIQQIDALSRIASEFSDFARMPNPHKTPCDVNGIVADAVRLYEREEGVTFRTALAPDLRPVIADREELHRAFINILRNAVQAMDGRGRIDVTTAGDGSVAVITIRDDGPGMSEEVRARLFQPDFSTKTDGMGLGLAIVRKTIDDLGGEVAIDSAEGKGTTVTIRLPFAPPA